MAAGGAPSILLGMIGLGCVAIWPFLRCLRRVIVVQGVGATAFALQFAFLGASTAAVACGISLAQLLIALTVGDRRTRLALNVVSLALLVTLVFFTWAGISSLLACCGGIVSMVARNQPSPIRMKVGFLIGAPFWLAHNIIVGAPFALTVDFISAVTNIGGLCLAAFGARSSLQAAGSGAAFREAGGVYGASFSRRLGWAGFLRLNRYPVAVQRERRT
ncbi:MAG: hypothetical protein ACJAWY_001747 [Sphingomonas echinoides]|jgi:hypothetical protein